MPKVKVVAEVKAGASNEVEKPEQPPERLIGGVFTLYATPAGGVHVALRLDHEDEDRHLELPTMLVKAAGMRLGGDPVAVLRALRDGNPVP